MDSTKIAVVMVRGQVGLSKKLKDTMRMLGLTRINHCVIVKEEQIGMIRKCKDYLTWGSIDEETFTMLLTKRGMKTGDKRLSEEDIKSSGFDSVNVFVSKFFKSESKLSDIGVKKVFRLHPPRKGHLQVKKQYPYGALGDRKEEMNALLKRMM